MTEPIYYGENFGAQSHALALLATLAEQHASLPPAYVTCSGLEPNKVTVLVEHPDQFEAWRGTLLVAPEDVVQGTLTSNTTLAFDVSLHGVNMHVWTSFELAKSEIEGAAA